MSPRRLVPLAALAAFALILAFGPPRCASAALPAWVTRNPAALGDTAPRVTVRDGHALLCWSETDPRDGRRWWALVKVPLAGDVPAPVTAADRLVCEAGA